MSDAAQETVTEAPAQEAPQDEYVPGLDPDPELPDFDLFGEDIAESAPVEAKKEPATEAPQHDDSWSSKVKKDRDQRKREIELKRREQSIAQKEGSVASLENLRENFLKNPEQFLEAQGIDPLDFYSDWTDRLAKGSNEMGADLRLSETERELKALKEEMSKRDGRRLREEAGKRQEQEIRKYYSQISSFMKSEEAEQYPLAREQCTPEDVAQGIAAYYEKTGVELSLDEAFKKVETGLLKREQDIYGDPAVIAKFKQYHGLEASNKKGRRSQVTLSNTLQTQPTKTPAEEMSDDEIYEFWKGKLFT